MCPSAAASDSTTVPTTNGEVSGEFQAVDAHAPSAPEAAAKKSEATASPYGNRYSDFLSNVSTAARRARLLSVRGTHASPFAARRPTGRSSSRPSEVSIRRLGSVSTRGDGVESVGRGGAAVEAGPRTKSREISSLTSGFRRRAQRESSSPTHFSTPRPR